MMILFLLTATYAIFSLVSFRIIDKHCKAYYCDGQLIRDWDSSIAENSYYITFALKMIAIVGAVIYFLATMT